MKKIITAIALVMTVLSLLLVMGACGEDKDDMTNTSSTTENISTTENPGMITDESQSDENGALGEMVSDISEGMSEAMTDVSEGISKVVE